MSQRNSLASFGYAEMMMGALIAAHGTKMNGWELCQDGYMGAWYWQSDDGSRLIYASPFWEDREAISLQMVDDCGDLSDTLRAAIDFLPSGDLAKDANRYLSLTLPMLSILATRQDQETWQRTRPSLLQCTACKAIETPEQLENQGALCKCGSSSFDIYE